MFILATWKPEIEGLQGIGVACAIGGVWYIVPYEIDQALNPSQWIADNQAVILADAPTKGVILDVATTVRELLDGQRGLDAQQMIDDLDDIADLNEYIALRNLMKAVALVIMDELNLVRAALKPALPARTPSQIRAALRAKLKEIA